MGLDLQVGNERDQQFRILPVHLHMINFGVETNGTKQGLEGIRIEQELIPAEAASTKHYSTHSR